MTAFDKYENEPKEMVNDIKKQDSDDDYNLNHICNICKLLKKQNKQLKKQNKQLKKQNKQLKKQCCPRKRTAEPSGQPDQEESKKAKETGEKAKSFKDRLCDTFIKVLPRLLTAAVTAATSLILGRHRYAKSRMRAAI